MLMVSAEVVRCWEFWFGKLITTGANEIIIILICFLHSAPKTDHSHIYLNASVGHNDHIYAEASLTSKFLLRGFVNISKNRMISNVIVSRNPYSHRFNNNYLQQSDWETVKRDIYSFTLSTLAAVDNGSSKYCNRWIQIRAQKVKNSGLGPWIDE